MRISLIVHRNSVGLYHKKHRDEDHPEISDYYAKSMQVLRKPEAVYAYRHHDEVYDEYDDRIAFVKNIKGKKYIVAISPYSGKITTCFEPSDSDYTKKYMRLE